jgi:phosphate starvation-inducible protein PhoH
LELTITLEDAAKRAALFGSADRHLRLIRGTLGVQISARDSKLKVSGHARAVGQAATVIEDLQRLLRDHDFLTDEQVSGSILASQQNTMKSGNGDGIDVYTRTANIQPRTDGQRA